MLKYFSLSINAYLPILILIFILFQAGPAYTQFTAKQYKSFKYKSDQSYAPLNWETLQHEISKVLAAQNAMTEKDIVEINYWNAVYPSYRWHQIMMKISNEYKGHKNGARVVLLHLAIYDALVDVWKRKDTIRQRVPFEKSVKIQRLGREREYSTFICEYSAAAGAAHQMITYYFPDQKLYLDSLLQQFTIARLKTGLQFPADIESGLAIGKQIAEQYIDYAKTDGTNQEWTVKLPNNDKLWSGKPSKWDPMKAQWKPLTLKQNDQFQPEAPPADWEKDMEELRQFNQQNQFSDIAWKWKSESVWDNLIERKILEYDLSPLDAAFANAIFHTARFDATIAAWEAKYHYWTIRPFQYDTAFKPLLVETPNFPGYPAGHSTVAGSVATVLSFLFPLEQVEFTQLAKECAQSRFEGGVHFRTDNEMGLKVGEKVGNYIVEYFQQEIISHR